MTRKHGVSANGSGLAEVSVFWVTVKGDQNVVQQALLTAQNIAKASGSHMPAVLTPRPPSVALPSASTIRDEGPADDDKINSPPPAVQQSRRGTWEPRKSKLISELDVMKGPSPLAAFCGESEIAHWDDRAIVSATWMRESRGRDEFTMDDIFTCFKLHWDDAPEDMHSLIKRLKRDQLIDPGAKRGTYKLTVLADKKVATLLA